MKATSPRQRQGAGQRHAQDATSPPSHCLEVQWRFLQRRNPTPPRSRSPSVNVAVNGLGSPQPGRDSPSHLFQLFQTPESESEDHRIAGSDSPHYGGKPAPAAASRVLNDLMGETQRQTMLDRILAEMEDLAVEPVYPRLGQSPVPVSDQKAASPPHAHVRKASVLQSAFQSDTKAATDVALLPQRKFSSLGAINGRHGPLEEEEDDDESTHGGRSRHQALHQDAQTPRIFWQQATGVRFARDVPLCLQSRTPTVHKLKRAPTIVMGRCSHTPGGASQLSGDERRRLAAQLSSATPSEPSSDGRTVATHVQAGTETKKVVMSPRRPVRASRAPETRESPPKTQYGVWYIPQTEWWPLRQLEAAHKLPKAASEPHCHHSAGRQHKPSLPSAVRAPGGRERTDGCSAESSSPRTGRRASSLSCSGVTAAPSAASPSPSSLEVPAIPETYIGREYRAYLLNTGAVLPQYLR